MKFVDKITSILELVIEDFLFFLVESYFELVLNDASKIGHCKVDLHNICCELCHISIKVKTVLK